MFKFCRIIGIWKIEFFSFSGTERVNGSCNTLGGLTGKISVANKTEAAISFF